MFCDIQNLNLILKIKICRNFAANLPQFGASYLPICIIGKNIARRQIIRRKE
jgi:hypothetical protein